MTQPVTRFCLVRHGETDWNREYRLQGHTDIPLNDTGLEQAIQLARAFSPGQHRFDALYVSDLTRTRQTAAPLADKLRLAALDTPQLRERHMGALQGLTYAEAAQRIPDIYQRQQTRDPDYDLEGGESLRRFRARVLDGMASIAALHPGEDVLIVTHGGVLDIMYRAATAKPLEDKRDFPIPNAALNWLDYQDGSWTLRRWADESHLSGALDEIQ
ncbi:phosphoglycerate mutase family protein [Chromobacterium subtsugae]|uniref:Phosphoglycerate mutase family protein n=1 Tax=Chromobacterium subtsugae TaxID=251747 RepID=A0ABS7FAP4_9NEIS|nr:MULTISPECIES: histidine phosphatase family protein [Chromobacterium]KUM02980.1 phosphoglycerate kinase [Chromobacterium subtsugae]KZE87243.1 phosphoglycerate kinase [Chromobacterium sp. F49]MBW7565800.1 histidine phosphatase family protein [Chromobacterium subtsugae]MBW8287160.1 phosphoglycerate mutase family protein [Chromobacterium subtsugae]OBU88093.1 phosphoglycerate kinase [Chromobacterium subtsugae]